MEQPDGPHGSKCRCFLRSSQLRWVCTQDAVVHCFWCALWLCFLVWWQHQRALCWRGGPVSDRLTLFVRSFLNNIKDSIESEFWMITKTFPPVWLDGALGLLFGCSDRRTTSGQETTSQDRVLGNTQSRWFYGARRGTEQDITVDKMCQKLLFHFWKVQIVTMCAPFSNYYFA